jgi:hypothetical protein
VPIRERARLAGYALRRAAWRAHYRHPRFDAPPHDPILVVFGMHRSGTSAAVGILEDLGFKVPGTLPPDGTGDNERGTREPTELTSLTNDVLQVNNSSWRTPPAGAVRYLHRHVATRNNLIGRCVDERYVLKDPRMLLMPELWSGLSIKPMAVVRNPIDVADSLVRRGEPMTLKQGVALWKIYNRALLRYARAHDCPIVLFDQPSFAEQVVRCAQHHGHSHRAAARFFDDRLVRSRTENWREIVGDDEAVTQYDELAEIAISQPELSYKR